MMIVDPRRCEPGQYCRLLDLQSQLMDDLRKGKRTAEKSIQIAIQQCFEIATDKEVQHAY